MKRILTALASLLLLLFSCVGFAKEVAITLDDLPFVGMAGNTPMGLQRETERFMMIVDVLRKNNIPVVGFAIGEAVWNQDQMELLRKFTEGGNLIGNHTYTHPNFNRMSAAKYIAQIDKTDQRLEPLMTGHPKYFRYPYLAEGNSPQKYFAVRDFLKSKGYEVAPVTIDSNDWRFNARLMHVNWRVREQYIAGVQARYLAYITRQIDKAESEAQSTEGRPIKHILLLHMNYLNAYSMEKVIEIFRNKGYTFVTLQEALADPFYQKHNEHYSKYKQKYSTQTQAQTQTTAD